MFGDLIWTRVRMWAYGELQTRLIIMIKKALE